MAAAALVANVRRPNLIVRQSKLPDRPTDSGDRRKNRFVRWANIQFLLFAITLTCNLIQSPHNRANKTRHNTMKSPAKSCSINVCTETKVYSVDQDRQQQSVRKNTVRTRDTIVGVTEIDRPGFLSNLTSNHNSVCHKQFHPIFFLRNPIFRWTEPTYWSHLVKTGLGYTG